MAAIRDARGRFLVKEADALSGDYRRRIERGASLRKPLRETRGHGVTAQAMWRSSASVDKETYRKALTVLSRMRHGESLYAAARAERTTPDAVQRQVGAALSRDHRGRYVAAPSDRYVAAPSDRYVRRMKFLDARGTVIVEPANSREASKLAAYWSAVDRYLRTGDDRLLRPFRRKLLRVRGKIQLPFITDLETLDRLARAGELSFEDLYELAA